MAVKQLLRTTFICLMKKKNWMTLLLVQFIFAVTAETELIHAREGYDFTLTCTSIPNLIVNWEYSSDVTLKTIIAINEFAFDSNYMPFKDRLSVVFKPTEGVYMLTLLLFRGETDRGSYYCFSEKKEINKTFDIILAEGPTTATITGYSPPVFADGTRSLTLTCAATAAPGVVFEWRKGGTITGGSSSTLTLSPVQASDNGASIECRAMNTEYNDIQASDSVTLTVYYGPDSADIVGNSTVYADDVNTLTFTCTAADSYPGVRFQWTKGGTSIGDNSDTLTFTPVPTDHDKDVVCIATNTGHQNRQARDNVALTVYYGPKSVTITGGPVYVDGTNNLTLTCTAEEYNPDVGFQWKERNQNINGENTNTYTKIANKTDNGRNLTCLTWNTKYTNKRKETSTKLTVYYAPSGPVITGYQDTEILGENDNTKTTVALSCTATDGFPETTLTWSGLCSSNGATATSASSVTTSSSVQITRSINQKTCTCAGTQPKTPWTGQSDVTFTVHFGPDRIQITTGGNELLENKNVNITCTTTEANPTKEIMWYNVTDIVTVNSQYNHQTGNNHGTVTSQTWNRQLSWYDNKSVIKCATTNQLGDVVSDSTELDVKYGAKDTSIQAPPVTSEGDGITVICSSHSNPDPTFNITGPTLRSSNNRLGINNISRSDGGEYSCTAGNVHYMQTITTTVVVNYPPDVTVTYGNATENDTGITITCVAKGKPQSYNFSTWKHIGPDGQTIIRELQGVHNEGQLTLTFPDPVSYEDSGYYECTVNNGVKGRSPHMDQTKMSTYFIIEGTPKILEKDDDVHGDLGDAVSIEVKFYSVPEYTSVNWYLLNGSQLNVSQHNITIQATDTLETTFHGHSVKVSGYVTTLMFDSVKAADFVSYRVVVNNTEGIASVVKTLKGITKPCTPGNDTFKAEVRNRNTIEIRWTSGCNGGTKQTFHVEYKKSSSQEWILFETVEENQSNEIYSVTISDLEPGTQYDIRILAKNAKGQSDYKEISSVTHPDDDEPPNQGAIIGGSIGVVAAILVCVVVFLFMWRRRWTKKAKSGMEMTNDRRNLDPNLEEGDSAENPMYVSSGPSPKPEAAEYSEVKKIKKPPPTQDGGEAVYSQVKKKGKVEGDDNVYSQVKKKGKVEGDDNVYSQVKKKNDKVEGDDNVYSQVNKKADPKVKGAAGKSKPKKKEDKKNKNKKAMREDVYENACLGTENDTYGNASLVAGARGNNGACDNAAFTESNDNKRLRNKDGLIYADLAFAETNQQQAAPIIHGLENTTDYAAIDFTKRGPTPPQADVPEPGTAKEETQN